MSAVIAIQFIVPLGYEPGDYMQLHSNNGVGSIDWDSPLNNQIFELFPGGAGCYGFGYAPFGQFRFGEPHPMGTAGFGEMPFGLFPFGYGSAVIEAGHQVAACGAWNFGFKAYDSLGNAHTGTPEEVTVHVHIAPPEPTRLSKNSYNKTTDVLVLNAA